MSLEPVTDLLDRFFAAGASRTRRRLLLAAACVLVTLGVTSSAWASTVLQLDLESLVANSQQIVDGTVTRVQPKVENGKVYTYTTIAVKEGLKGAQAGDTVTVRQLGGRTDDLATWVPGIPDFQAGERVIVFLEKANAHAMPVVTGMSQGKFHIALGPDNVTPYVVPFLGDLALIKPRQTGTTTTSPQGQALNQQDAAGATFQPAQPATLYRRVVPLDVFKQRVRDVIRGQGDE